MSLQVWLPLNGDLHNQGASGIIATAIVTPTYTAGKIGQCYQRANSNSQLTNGLSLDSNLLDMLGTQASVAVWVKPLGTHTHYNGTILSSGNWNGKKWAFGVSQDNSKVDVLCGSYNNYITCAVPVNEWTHLVSTFDNGTCKLYKNGAYVGQLTGQAAFASDATWTGVGRETYAGGYFGFNGCINDLRIYDHVLSAAEVREISQGLVVHYKLDSPYIESTVNLAAGVIGYNYVQKEVATYATTIQGKTTYGNKIFTYSAYIKNTSDNPLAVRFNPYNAADTSYSAFNGNYIQPGQEGRSIVTVDITDTSKWNGKVILYIQNGNAGTVPTNKTFYIKEVQVEEKNHATPFTPNTRNNTIIQDSSGYNHNGTITGTISIDSGSPRYQSSVYVNGSSYILTPAGSFAWNDLTQLTFSAWMKPTASMTGWRGSVGIAADSNQTARGIAITDYGNEFRGTYTNGSGYVTVATGKTLTQNEWHHCAGTLNGTEFKLYFDGALVKTQTIDWGTATLNANARFEVGVDLPGTDEKFTGNYSDVRCYCTALDADAIRQLYEVGAKVDNKQNLHTFEINELSSNIFRSELIMPWAKTTGPRIGEVVEHNGAYALNIAPAPFYQNISGNLSGALNGMFQTGSYVFDMWIDVDSVISGGTNRTGGMIIRYTDDTLDYTFSIVGGNLGYQHKILITPANKNIQRIEFYYYTSTDVFYRIDSCIYPINETKFFKTGVVQNAGFLEDTKSRIIKNGIIEANEIIEL